MHIGIIGPIATADVAHLLGDDVRGLPSGYAGGPLLATLIGELIARGHQVTAFTLSSDMPLESSRAIIATGLNFSLHFCRMRTSAWRSNGQHTGRILDFFRVEIDALMKEIAQVQPDVIHAHWTYEFALAAIATSVPHVVTCHDSPYTIARLTSTSRPTRSIYRWLRVIMAHRVFKAAKHVTAVSPYMKAKVQWLAQVDIDVVPNPVDAKALAYSNARSAPLVPRLAMVCNGWDSLKNPKPGLIAFSQLVKQRPGAELHLFGNDFGPGQAVERWCKSEGLLTGLVFHGAMPHYQLLDHLTKFDLLLHPSIEESFGMVLAEAMAMGLPVVAGKRSGAVPWVVGDTRCLCDVTDAAAIHATLCKVLIPGTYADLSARGIDEVQRRFSTPRVVDQFFSIYEAAIRMSNENAVMVAPPARLK